jgi:hypothetical protein
MTSIWDTTDHPVARVIVVLFVIIVITYLYFRHKFSFWSRQGIRGPDPIPFLGALHIYREGSMIQVEEFYKAVGGHSGMVNQMKIGDMVKFLA